MVILFVTLWRYYDHIDDRSFNRFRKTYRDEEKAPRLLRETAYKAGLITTVVCASPVITLALAPALYATGLGMALSLAVGFPISVALVISLSLLRIRRRSPVVRPAKSPRGHG